MRFSSLEPVESERGVDFGISERFFGLGGLDPADFMGIDNSERYLLDPTTTTTTTTTTSTTTTTVTNYHNKGPVGKIAKLSYFIKINLKTSESMR